MMEFTMHHGGMLQKATRSGKRQKIMLQMPAIFRKVGRVDLNAA